MANTLVDLENEITADINTIPPGATKISGAKMRSILFKVLELLRGMRPTINLVADTTYHYHHALNVAQVTVTAFAVDDTDGIKKDISAGLIFSEHATDPLNYIDISSGTSISNVTLIVK